MELLVHELHEYGARTRNVRSYPPMSSRDDASDGTASGDVDRDLDQRGLTDREVDLLRLVARGLTNSEIGAELFISAGTAGVHVSNILRKLGVSGRVQAAGIAHQMGLLAE